MLPEFQVSAVHAFRIGLREGISGILSTIVGSDSGALGLDEGNKAANKEVKNMSIFTILFVLLLIAWILGWGVFHVASAMIHLLLIVALISLVLHFVRGPRAV